MASSIAWVLSKLRFPLKPALGGISAGYIEGLNFSILTDNTLVVETGVAVCPYTSGNRPVSLPAPVTINVPNGPGNTRTHIWLHDDDNDGIGTVAVSSDAIEGYWGMASTNPAHNGWRYLGSIQFGSGGLPLRCIANMGVMKFIAPTNVQTAFDLINTTGQVAARSVNTDNCAPSTSYMPIINFASSGAVWRIAASAQYAGFTVSTGTFTHAITAATGEIPVAVGPDRTIQYASDAAGGTLIARLTGYHFKR